MKLSILIVNWRSKDYLRQCLTTIRRTCAELTPQVVIVDGGSYDGCGEMLAAEFPEVEFVQCEQNLGFGRSNNLGFECVTGDTLLLLNPDTELKPGSVQSLLAALDQYPNAGLIGPLLLNTDGTRQSTCVRALPTPLNQALDSEFLRRLFPASSLWGLAGTFDSVAPVKVEAVSGACMLLRSDLFRQLRGFSPAFFMYGEDMDLCAKVLRAGLAVYHDPRAVVVHHGGCSSQTQASQFSTIMMRVAGETYMKLNHGPGTAIHYRVLQALSALVRLTLVLPACLLPSSSHRTAARGSLKKWWCVLRWATGTIPMSGSIAIIQ